MHGYGWCVIENDGQRAAAWVDIEDPRVIAGPYETHDEAFAATIVAAGKLWVLGADDPEMERIERLLRESGAMVAYAVGPDRERVQPGNAYQATGICTPVVSSDFDQIVLIACSLPESIAAHPHPDVVVFNRLRVGLSG